MIGVVMGSGRDWPVMRVAVQTLDEFGVANEYRVVSAHRTPELLYEYAKTAADRGMKAIVAGAGGAAHLPGMLAALTPVPVLGVPIALAGGLVSGLDSLLSIVQMPAGVPVATFGLNGAKNAALFAVSMLAVEDAELRFRYLGWRKGQTVDVAIEGNRLMKE